MNEYWIVKGNITNPEVWHELGHPDAKAGDIEWQISDGPPGDRGSSADYLSLEEAISAHAPAIFHFVE